MKFDNSTFCSFSMLWGYAPEAFIFMEARYEEISHAWIRKVKIYERWRHRTNEGRHAHRSSWQLCNTHKNNWTRLVFLGRAILTNITSFIYKYLIVNSFQNTHNQSNKLFFFCRSIFYFSTLILLIQFLVY